MLAQLDKQQLSQFQAQTEQMADQAPQENQDMFNAIRQLIQERLDQVGGIQ